MAEARGVWNEISVGGHPCHVYEPPNPSEHNYVVLYLHGVHLGHLRDHSSFIEQFDRHGLRMIGPITQRSWWTDRICTEFDTEVSAERHVLNCVLPEIESRWNVTAPRVALLGTSMGGQGALRFAFKHPDRFPIVAAISPAIDYQTRWNEGDETIPLMYGDAEEARQDTATLHIHPLNWPRNTWFCCDPMDHRWHTSADRLHMKLSALGIPHEHVLDREGGGHGFEYYNQMAASAIEFLAARLEQERLRVV